MGYHQHDHFVELSATYHPIIIIVIVLLLNIHTYVSYMYHICIIYVLYMYYICIIYALYINDDTDHNDHNDHNIFPFPVPTLTPTPQTREVGALRNRLFVNAASARGGCT